MNALIGLGNPGLEYEKSRHNVGFLALDLAAKKLGISVNKHRCKGLLGEGKSGDNRVILLKPQTYMNLSGLSVEALLSWYKMTPSEVMVLSDDIDLAPGVLRIRASGGPGTHNGWRSIQEITKTDLFPRARIGIGSPPVGWELKDWVLSKWEKDENAPFIQEAIEFASQAAVSFLQRGIGLTMNQFNIKSRNHAPTGTMGDLE